jgi:DNA-binding NarL/FixJ family response regulator
MPIRVVVADDHLLVREGILRLLQGVPDIEVVATTADRDGLMTAVDEQAPDMVLTDIRMPPSHRTEGIEIANELRERHPTTGVIVLSQYLDATYALALLEDGAARRGYILKDRLGDRVQLLSAIRQVAAGGSVIDPQVVEKLVERQSLDAASRMHRLTPREREVLSEVASGKSNAAIAATLVISKRAVERHISSIFSKLNLPDEEKSSRRVTATLLFLADRDS